MHHDVFAEFRKVESNYLRVHIAKYSFEKTREILPFTISSYISQLKLQLRGRCSNF